VNQLDLTETQVSGIPELMEDLAESDQEGKGRGAIEAATEKVSDFLGDNDDDQEEEDTGRGRASKKTAPSKKTAAPRKTTAATAKRSSRTRKSTKT